MRPSTDIRLVIGLGNPGAEFENTYHNVGFLALDEMIARASDEAPVWKTHKKIFLYTRVGKTVFVKPLTFMNESGVAVKEVFKKFGISPKEISVLHDESDLTIGDFKISTGKNAAGHRGVQSITDQLGTNEFERIRIGIRPASEGTRKKASAFVLSRITEKDRGTLEEVFKKIAKATS